MQPIQFCCERPAGAHLGHVVGKKGVKDRLVAEGHQGPDLKEGLPETSERASLRPPHLKVISLGALVKWSTGSLGVKNACLRADGSRRDVFVWDPSERIPERVRRTRILHAPAYGFNDAPAAVHGALRRYLSQSDNSVARVGSRFRVASCGLR